MSKADEATREPSIKGLLLGRGIVVAGILLILLAVYALSPGPIIVLAVRFEAPSWLEGVFEVVYWPLAQVIESNDAIQDWYQRYIQWWFRITGTSIPWGGP